MKKLIIPLLLAIYLLSTSSSCKKTPVTEFNKEFPNTSGTWWKYKVYDSVTSTLDTITISVLGNSKLDNGMDVKIWQINSLNSYKPVDTNYVYSGPDGIKFYYNKSTQSFYKAYKFPLEVGKYWIGIQPQDTIRVISKGDITVPAGTFIDNYIIERRVRYIPNGSLYEKEYFLPNIGVITRVHQAFISWPFSQYWELVAYSIK